MYFKYQQLCLMHLVLSDFHCTITEVKIHHNLDFFKKIFSYVIYTVSIFLRVFSRNVINLTGKHLSMICNF